MANLDAEASSATVPDLVAGTVLGGRYQLITAPERAGAVLRGRARDIVLGREVEVRFLAPQMADDGDLVDRFEAWTQAAARLAHPVLPLVFDNGRHGAVPFVVTEGLAPERGSPVPLPAEKAIATVVAVAEAIDAARRQGIHCPPATPATIVLTAGGPKLVPADPLATAVDEGVHVEALAALLAALAAGPPPAAAAAAVERAGAGPGALARLAAGLAAIAAPAPTRLLSWRAADTTTELVPPSDADDAAVPHDRRRRALPLGVRLTAGVAVVLLAGLAVVGTLAVQRARAHLERDLERRLVAVADSFRAGPATAVTDPAALGSAARGWLAALPQPADQVVVVRTAAGEILSTRSGLDLRALAGGDRLLRSAESRWWALRGADGEVRALTVPLTLDGRPAGTLVAAASTAPINDVAANLRGQVVIAGAIGFLVAIALAALAVRRSLRPLARMSAAVDAIQAAGDLSRRVPGDGPDDEVGRLGRAFNRTLGSLERAFAAHRQFVADASHELRTPLTVARGQLELLSDSLAGAGGGEGTDGSGRRRSAGVALDELDRMGRIVDDLLLLARLDEGLPLRRERVEIDLVVREALLRGLGRGGAGAAVDVPQGLAAVADPDRLLQVLTNLVANAASHGGPGTRINVTGRHERGRTVTEIIDDGPGIPPGEVAAVFERFYRGSGARSRATGGAGLGLAIARTLVERMGGEIVVSSALGQGSTFTVRLPGDSAPDA